MGEEMTLSHKNNWIASSEQFKAWLNNREHLLEPGLSPDPTIKVLAFLALLDSNKACTYDEIVEIFHHKKVIKGIVPDNTLRTSLMSLGKTLEKSNHPLELKSLRGRFQLIPRAKKSATAVSHHETDPVVLLLDAPAMQTEEIAINLIEKGMLPFHALYFLEWSARWWEIYSNRETEIRVQYEANAWEKLGIKNRLCKSDGSSELICLVGLAPGEGLAEIELIKKILADNTKQVHYLAIDSSQRLLRDHVNLLHETLKPEIDTGRLTCAGTVSDIFHGLQDAINRARQEFVTRGLFRTENEFLPTDASMLVTYLGNCLGNNVHDQETEIFSKIHSVLKHRPLDFLVGFSCMRPTPDVYKRTWDDFLLQTPKHLLETTKFLTSSRPDDSDELPEFRLSQNPDENNRCPAVEPEPYLARHQIKGQIYRFYYKLAFDLSLAKSINKNLQSLPKGTMILLYNIIKYDMESLVAGIEKCGLFKIECDYNYRQILDSSNGIREYAVISAYLEK